jgi:hypothetical protein
VAETVAVRVNYDESVLRQKVKEAGGRWNAERRVWLMPLGRVRALGLLDRIASPRQRVRPYAIGNLFISIETSFYY